MPTLKINDSIELFYEELGSGDKYILSLEMDFPPECTTRRLADHGYHVFCITNRGIGGSTHIFEDYGNDWFDIWADDVVRFADLKGIDRFVYCGCSHGAGTGWHIALRHPERLIAFIDMVGGPHNIDEAKISYRASLKDGKPRKPMNPEFIDDPAVMERRGRNGEYYSECAKRETPEERNIDYKRPLIKLGNEEKVKEALRTIQTPTLMLGGIEDPISRPDLMMRTAECLPHGKLVMYSGFGHAGPYSEIVEEAVEEAVNFLRNVEETGKVYKKVQK